mmetsp:Transcript_13243/g.28505  ORF Transcript_13243/g.28505 Transcript_13243/m.28505 type:complete len:89 (-) Transcript_13243:271-537(-)
MRLQRMRLPLALEHVQQRRQIVSPNRGFLHALWLDEAAVFGSNSSTDLEALFAAIGAVPIPGTSKRDASDALTRLTADTGPRKWCNVS